MDELPNGDVLILHLINGMNVIGKLNEHNDSGIQLTRPCDLIGREGPQGKVQLGFAPVFTIGGALPPLETFAYEHGIIMFSRAAPQQIADGYLEATTGLRLARGAPAQQPLVR